MLTHDHKKLHPQVYGMKPGPPLVQQIPALQFVSQEMVSALHMDWIGHPKPHGEKWLVPQVVNQLKQMTKTRMEYKFKLMPHEIIWKERSETHLSSFSYMMQVPACITLEMYEEAVHRVRKRERGEFFPTMRFVATPPQLCAQKLHVGHYRETRVTLQEIIREVEGRGHGVRGNQRDIYLTPSMGCYASPATWKSIVRIEIEPSIAPASGEIIGNLGDYD